MKKAAFLIAAFLTLPLSVRAGVNPNTSRIIFDRDVQNANGSALIHVTVEVKDKDGNPVSGQPVTLVSDNSDFMINQPAAPTNTLGVASGSVATRTATPTAGSIRAFVDGVLIDPNLLENPSFEGGIAGSTFSCSNAGADKGIWNKFACPSAINSENLYSWSLTGGTYTAKGALVNITTTAVDGPNYNWNVGLFQKTLPSLIEPGATYYLSADVKYEDVTPNPLDSNAGALMAVYTQNVSEQLLSRYEAGPFTGASGWNRVEISSIVAPSAAYFMEVSFELLSASGTVRVDNARLAKRPNVRFEQDTTAPSRVEVLKATASAVDNGAVALTWTGTGNDGVSYSNSIGHYEIFYATYNFYQNPLAPGVAKQAAAMTPSAPANPMPLEAPYILGHLSPGGLYYFSVRAVDQSGNAGAMSPMAESMSSQNTYAIPPVVLMNDTSVPFPARPTFTGTAAAGVDIHIYIDGLEDGLVVSDYKGRWDYAVSKELKGGTHVFLCYAADSRGNKSQVTEFSFSVGANVIEDALNLPYPNPVRLGDGLALKVPYALADDASLTITVFDVTGAEVRRLASGYHAAGTGEAVWDGRDSTGNTVGSGVYHVLLSAGSKKIVRSVTVLR